jgi:hypothetical protein
MRSVFIWLAQVHFRTLFKRVTDVLVSKNLGDLFDHMRKRQILKKHSSVELSPLSQPTKNSENNNKTIPWKWN